MIDARRLVKRASADPDDDLFVAAAIAGEADAVVSCDKHWPDVPGWSGISVLNPRAIPDGPLGSRPAKGICS